MEELTRRERQRQPGRERPVGRVQSEWQGRKEWGAPIAREVVLFAVPLKKMNNHVLNDRYTIKLSGEMCNSTYMQSDLHLRRLLVLWCQVFSWLLHVLSHCSPETHDKTLQGVTGN